VPAVLRYADRRRGQWRSVRTARRGADTRLEAFLLAGDTGGEAWMRALLQDEAPAQAYGRRLLAPGAHPPATGLPARSRQVCNCANVSEAQIGAALEHCTRNADERLRYLKDELACGSRCGSCLPEIRRLLGR